MITLYQYPRLFGIPNASPFCLKLETYLILAGHEYNVVEVNDPRGAPKGKLPYIDFDGELIADSRIIIDSLVRTTGVDLDQSLTAQEKAISVAFATMIEEHYYWSILYDRWVGDNWPQVRQAFFGKLPPGVRTVVPVMIHRQMQHAVTAQGVGRHSDEEAFKLANQDVRAVVDYLGDKSYFMGDQPTRVDATLFAFLANVALVPLESPLQQYIHNCDKLMAYLDRINTRCYSAL